MIQIAITVKMVIKLDCHMVTRYCTTAPKHMTQNSSSNSGCKLKITYKANYKHFSCIRAMRLSGIIRYHLAYMLSSLGRSSSGKFCSKLGVKNTKVLASSGTFL